MTGIPSSHPGLRPHAVDGQREFHLRTQIPGQHAPSLAEALAQELEAAGARREESHLDGIVLTCRRDGELEPVVIHIHGHRLDEGPTLTIRIRPDNIHQTNILPPRFIHDVVIDFLGRHDARIAGAPLQHAPRAMAGPIAAARFVETQLMARTPRLPIVVVTAGPHAEPESVARLARDLAGFATVWNADAPAANALVTKLGKERSVYGGAVRIYRPGYTPYDDPLDHDLMITSYLERRVGNGRTLSDEIARRVLPEAGEHITRTKVTPTPVSVRIPAAPRRPNAEGRLATLEEEVASLRDENELLRDEVRNLNDAIRAAKQELEAARASSQRPSVPVTQFEHLPWALENPNRHPVELAEHFIDQIERVARDGSLAEDVRRKMEAVLEKPEDYGKDMRGARKGQRACYVANNYRLVWSVNGRTVRFILIVSKEDPEYSPHGA